MQLNTKIIHINKMSRGNRKTKITNKSYEGKKHRRKTQETTLRLPKYFGLIIFESLNSQEKQTGEILHNETIKYKKFQEPNLSTILLKVTNKSEFISLLRELKNQIKTKKLFPILHFETHGSPNGLYLSNGEEITWQELFKETREINLLLKNSLLINLSMCYGISMLSKINPSERAPFRAIVGTSTPISWNLLLDSFDIFYNNYFFSFSLESSVKIVNEFLKDEEVSFAYIKAEMFFDYFTDLKRDPDFIRRMINEFAIKEKATNPMFEKTEFNVVLKYAKEKIEGIFNETIQLRDYFLMKDVIGVFDKP